MEERLQKILAQAGFGSRRSCEELITAQRVRVNGKIALLGSKANAEKDAISVDGQAIPKIAVSTYIALNKPRNVLSDIDPNDPRQTVHDLVKVPGHLFAVGRLDYDSEGLILLTNDGELANRLTHPRYGHEKEYHVLVGNRPDEEQLAAWRRGVVLADGERTRPAEVFVDNIEGRGAWLRVVLREGRKRQIREVGSRIGLPVVRIVRVRIGTLLLGDIKVGEWRPLTTEEVRRLKSSVEKPARAFSARSTFPQPRSEGRAARGPAGDRAPSARKSTYHRDEEPSRGERRPGLPPQAGGKRTEWKPAPRSGGTQDKEEWQQSSRPKSGEQRPVRKPASSPRADQGSRDYRPASEQDKASGVPDRKPRTWQPSGRNVARPDHPASGADRKPFSWKKPGESPVDRHSGGRPTTNRNRQGVRPGNRPKGPRTPRG